MNPYLPYIQSLKQGLESAQSLTVERPPSASLTPQSSAPKILLFSPHPDDECITGLLALRLQKELGFDVINVPVTFGSLSSRQSERATELTHACDYLNWKNLPVRDDLQALTVADVIQVLGHWSPEVILFPHEQDWNSRHISTNQLMREALQGMPNSFSCQIIESEFWGAMDNPNLMLEGSEEEVAELVAATSLHVGEVSRNPYHLSLPFWMQDNVRRGSELVCGQGQTAPNFTFATLYRIRRWEDGQLQPPLSDNLVIPNGGNHLKEAHPWKS